MLVHDSPCQPDHDWKPFLACFWCFWDISMTISNGQNRDTPVSPFWSIKVTVVFTTKTPGYTWINGKLIIYSSLSISNNHSTLKATKNSIKVEKFWLLLSVINFHFNVRWKFAIILV